MLNTKEVTIRAPFYGAGSPKMYNWVKDGHKIEGIGLKFEDVRDFERFVVNLDGRKFFVTQKEIADSYVKYGGMHKAKRDNTLLIVFPTDIMTPIKTNEIPNI